MKYNNRFYYLVLLFILIATLSLSGCNNSKSDETIKLIFNPNQLESLRQNDEIKEYAQTYCDYYQLIITLYNHQIEDNGKYLFDYYEEFDLAHSTSDYAKLLCDNVKMEENEQLMAEMQVKISATNYLLARMNLDGLDLTSKSSSQAITEEAMKELYDNIIENYEFISPNG